MDYLTVIEDLLCAQHVGKCFSFYLIGFSLQPHTVGTVISLSCHVGWSLLNLDGAEPGMWPCLHSPGLGDSYLDNRANTFLFRGQGFKTTQGLWL